MIGSQLARLSQRILHICVHHHLARFLLLSMGIHPKVVQEMLEHSQISITMDIYSHMMPTLQREAATRLDALLQSEGS